MSELYQDNVIMRAVSILSGEGEHERKCTLTELASSPIPLLQAFAVDDDIQYMQIASTNVGFVHKYTKVYKSKTAEASDNSTTGGTGGEDAWQMRSDLERLARQDGCVAAGWALAEIERLRSENERLKTDRSLPHMGTVGDGGTITWDPPLKEVSDE